MARTRSTAIAGGVAASSAAQVLSNTTTAPLASTSPSAPENHQASNGATFDSSSMITKTLPGITVKIPFERVGSVSFQTKLPMEVQRMVFKELLVSGGPIITYKMAPNWEYDIKYDSRNLQGPKKDIFAESILGWCQGEIGLRLIATCDKDSCFYDSSLLNIAATCKSINAEVLPIFYGNTFDFRTLENLHLFLKNIGRTRRELITNIMFDFNGSKRNNAFELLAMCSRLKELKITTIKWTHHGQMRVDGEKLKRTPGFKALLKVRCSKVILVQNEFQDKGFTNLDIKETQEMMTKVMCVAKKEGYGGRRSTRAVKEKNYEEIPEDVDDVDDDDDE